MTAGGSLRTNACRGPLAVLATGLLLLFGAGVAAPAPAQPAAEATLDEIRALIANGQFAAADRALRELPDPGPEADYLLGFTLIRLYRYEEAEAHLRRATEAEPDNHAWLHALAKALIEQSKNLTAIEVLDRAIALEPHPDYRFAKAMCALNVGDLETAEAELRECLRTSSAHPDARYKLGKILVDRGGYREAIEPLETCLELEPGHLEARFLLGLAASRSGDLETARVAFEAVIAEIPGHVGALYNLGRVLLQLGRREEGRARLEEFRVLSPLQDRIDYFTRAVKKNARNLEVRLELATLQLEAGRNEDALEELLAARQIDPSHPATYRLLAEAFRRLGQRANAEAAAAFAGRLEGGRG